MSDDFIAKLRNCVAIAVADALSHANKRLHQVKAPEDIPIDTLPLVAAIEFTGSNAKGAMLVGCGPKFLDVTYPLKKRPDIGMDRLLRDWMGEMLNLLVGSFKRQLATHGAVIAPTPPTWLHYLSSPKDAFASFGVTRYGVAGISDQIWYRCDGNPACFQISGEFSAEYEEFLEEITE